MLKAAFGKPGGMTSLLKFMLCILLFEGSLPLQGEAAGSVGRTGQRVSSGSALPAAEISISSRVILVPRLPESVSIAHAQYRNFQLELQESLEGLLSSLKELELQALSDPALPPSLEVPEDRREEVIFLLATRDGRKYLELFQPVSKVWEEWRYRLTLSGDASPESNTLDPAKAESIRKEQMTSQRRVHQARETGMGLLSGWDVFEAKTGIKSAQSTGTLGMPQGEISGLMRFASRVADSQVSKRIRDQYAPQLSQRWDLLAEHLERQADDLLKYKSLAPRDGDRVMITLRRQAEISLLKQLHSAQSFSSGIWALMAQEDLPVPGSAR
jgi:hypothetical protein